MSRRGKSIASSWNRVCKGKRQAPAGCIQGHTRHPDTRLNTRAREGGGRKHKGLGPPLTPKSCHTRLIQATSRLHVHERKRNNSVLLLRLYVLYI